MILTSLRGVLRGAIHLLAVVVTTVGSLPVPTTSSSVTTPKPASHMMFLMTTELKILPKTVLLESLALDLLRAQCQSKDLGWRDAKCFNSTKHLPPIPGLEEFPSQNVLSREGSTVFTKHLFKDAHRTLKKLEKMLSSEVKKRQEVNNIVQELSSVRDLLQEQLLSYFGVSVTGSTGSLRKAKRRYLQEHPSHNEQDYLLRLYYTAWERLKQVGFAIRYTARLSWDTRPTNSVDHNLDLV